MRVVDFDGQLQEARPTPAPGGEEVATLLIVVAFVVEFVTKHGAHGERFVAVRGSRDQKPPVTHLFEERSPEWRTL